MEQPTGKLIVFGAQDFPDEDLVARGDLDEYTDRIRRLLMDWLLLDHL